MDKKDLSIFTGRKGEFGTVDYVLFSLAFVASAAIGFYHAYRDRNKRKAEDFHLGGRKMHPIPVSLSLSATFLSSLTLLGTPSEVYTNGTMFYWIVLAMVIAIAAAAHIFVPVFYRLNITSCFQYFEMRFGKVARFITSILFMIQTLVYMGFVLYAPSLALEAVTGVSLWGSMIGTAAICTLYTTLGGMKTVIWTDSLQFSIMVAGLLAVIIEGSKYANGFENAWNIANENGRIEFLEFSPDPKTRHSVWTVAIGGSFFWLYLYAVNQAQVQRVCSLPTLRKAKIAMWLNLVGLILIVTLTCMIGVVIYAVYQSCHPVTAGLINRSDQLLPLFVMDTLGKVPGLAGVFIACVFSGGLSTISSGLNAMSAVVQEDYLKPIANACKSKLFAKYGIVISKILVVVMGFIQFGFAVLISKFTGLIVQFSYSLYSITAGPIFGLFVAGMIFPWTNEIGAVAGFIVSLAFMCWLGLGKLIESPKGPSFPLPTYTYGCNNSLYTTTTLLPTSMATNMTTIMMNTDEPVLYDFYRISYQWYTGLGMIIAVFVAVLVSFLTGYTRADTIDSRLMCPIFDTMFPCLPESIRKPLRFGVVYGKEDKYAADHNKEGLDNNVFADDHNPNTKDGLDINAYADENNSSTNL
ncbi:sodium-coupled monocarboxylate transporter 1-like [Mya arenaria]|uniref:sodium-coupled monocarboxylate transporter 1-like n=1 Tax=Mya arenaria TaxID=6604 RepID=UPI0022E7F110|nr:sodium-coupled monocarboxylate transporter 1-like [Mya arenaria]